MEIQPLARSPIARILVVALAVRLISTGLSFTSNVAFPQAQPVQFQVVEPTNPFWNSFARFDSGWYGSIAQDGYKYIPDQPNTFAFFPIYPMLMRAGGVLLGGTRFAYFAAGIIVSWTAFLLAMVALYRVARLDVDEESAHRTVLYAAVFPFAFFYGKVYSESLFILLTLAVVYGLRSRHWLMAAVCGAAVSATRVNGVLLVPAAALLAWQHAGTDRRDRVAAALAVAAIPLGLAAYSVFNYVETGSFVEWLSSIRRWDYHPGGAPWEPLVALTRQLVRRPYEFLLEPNGLYDTLNGVTAMLFVASIPMVWKRFGAPYALFMAFNLTLPLSSGEFEGLGRYCSVLFPFFIWLGTLRNPTTQQLITVLFAGAYALCVSLFVNLHPIF